MEDSKYDFALDFHYKHISRQSRFSSGRAYP